MNQINTDILIIGGGSAGVAAAIGASSEGFSVTLIDAYPYLGGNATASEVGTICGLYHQDTAQDSTYLVDGFAREFSEKLRTLSSSAPIRNREGLHYLPYSIERYKELALEYLRKHNVKILLNTLIVDIDVSDGLAKSCVLNQNEKAFVVNFGSIIDCSGQSTISKLANLPMIKSDNFQAAALVFTMNKVHTDNISMLNLIIIKHLKQASLNGEIDSNLEKVFLVPGSLKKGFVSFKVAIPLEVTLTKNNLSALRKKGVEMIESIVQFFVSDIEIFEDAALDHIADDVGIRTNYRSIGKYILTEADVLSSRKFDNAIANCSWPIEEWGNSSKVKMDFLPNKEFYQIPVECLISAYIENLFLGGKNISATDRAIGSARVMGICFQTGFAAGKLASKFSKSHSTSNNLVTEYF